MQGLVVTPGIADSAAVVDLPAPDPGADRVLLRPLEVGVCGTDREIVEGRFGVAPEGERRLVLGHEVLAEVARTAHGFTRGDLVTATVRRSCGRCAACAAGAPDACATGDYAERGITRLHGFAAELVAEAPEHLVPVPATLGRFGVLAEPASVCERGLRHVRAIGGRQPWTAERALVLGTGAIGVLATFLLRLEGYEVWAAGRAPAGGGEKEALVTAVGARYASVAETPLRSLAEDAGGFDVVLEATGDAQTMVDAISLLRRNGVACLLGLDGRDQRVSLDGRVLGIDAVLENRAVFGSVNANRIDWRAAVAHLDAIRARWPDALEAVVGRSFALDALEGALAHRGVKATLALGR